MRQAGKRGCRALFRHPLDAEAIGDIRLARSQSQPLDNARFPAAAAAAAAAEEKAEEKGSGLVFCHRPR
jgi:hypothetical protein